MKFQERRQKVIELQECHREAKKLARALDLKYNRIDQLTEEINAHDQSISAKKARATEAEEQVEGP